MSDERRQLMLTVCDGHPEAPFYMYHINRFVRCDDILRWLIANRLKGREFIAWVKIEHKNSILNACNEALIDVERDQERRAIFAEKDYIIN